MSCVVCIIPITFAILFAVCQAINAGEMCFGAFHPVIFVPTYPLAYGDSQSEESLDVVRDCEGNLAVQSADCILPLALAVLQLEMIEWVYVPVRK